MVLSAGTKVVYPNQGPCKVGAVVEKNIGGRPGVFYPLLVMDDSGDVVFVPVDRVDNLGIRQLIRRSEIPRLIRHLRQRVVVSSEQTSRTGWKQRAVANSILFASGSAFDLATIVRTMTHLNQVKPLSPRDRDMLDKANRHLVCEISEVMGKTRSAAERLVKAALKATARPPLESVPSGRGPTPISAVAAHR